MRWRQGVPIVAGGWLTAILICAGTMQAAGRAQAPPVQSSASPQPQATLQRYCLTCGQPASPVRLAFLDVLQGDQATPPPTAPIAYTSLLEPASGPAWITTLCGRGRQVRGASRISICSCRERLACAGHTS